MTTIVEHKSFRYSWELIRHTYIIDLESEIDIQQVELSPAHESRLLPPPYPRTSLFEVEIDQIQKGGTTVSSFRNICPVEVNRKPVLNPLKNLIGGGAVRVVKRFQSQDGETETRWLYTDDFFLISLSSGDRHDLSMLVSLIIGKLNMIALSVQSGKRISSEFENQKKYRADMSTMFSKGVDGAFHAVPVYQQHGQMTESFIDVSAALRSAEFQDLNAVVASEENAAAASPAGQTSSSGPALAEVPAEEHTPEQGTVAEHAGVSPSQIGTIPEAATPEMLRESETLPGEFPEDRREESAVPETGPAAEEVPEEDIGESIIPETGPAAEEVPEEDIGESAVPSSGTGEKVPGKERPVIETVSIQADLPEELGETAPFSGTISREEPVPDRTEPEPEAENNAPVTIFPASRLCRGCGAPIPGTAKFCNSCGTPVVGTGAPREKITAARTCDSCGAGISGKAKFCNNCGTEVTDPVTPVVENSPAARTCGNCGTELSGSAKFCRSCGTSAGSSGGPPEEKQP